VNKKSVLIFSSNGEESQCRPKACYRICKDDLEVTRCINENEVIARELRGAKSLWRCNVQCPCRVKSGLSGGAARFVAESEAIESYGCCCRAARNCAQQKEAHEYG
jgi:hypothetical protein